jgi:drug/metabolite transporter (DMT)-like permease
LTVWALGHERSLAEAPPAALAWLAASGLLGLTLGDTALFSAVARMGPHRTLVVQSLAPVVTALLAGVWQGERLAPADAAAAAIILCGVIVVVAPGAPTAGAAPGGGGWPVAGLALGALAALSQGSGIVLAKAGASAVHPMPASFVRLGAAATGLVALAAAGGRLRRLRQVTRSPGALSRVVPAALLGTYLALFLMMTGLARAPASIAAVLLSTTPVFSLFVEARVERRPIRRRALVGTLLAVAGVTWLVAGG